MPLPTQVYKWVPAYFIAGGNLAMDLHPIQGGVEILLAASSYWNRRYAPAWWVTWLVCKLCLPIYMPTLIAEKKLVLIQQSRTAENVGNCCQTEQFMGRLKKSLPFLVKKITLLLSFLRKTTAEVRSFSFSKLVTSIVGSMTDCNKRWMHSAFDITVIVFVIISIPTRTAKTHLEKDYDKK